MHLNPERPKNNYFAPPKPPIKKENGVLELSRPERRRRRRATPFVAQPLPFLRATHHLLPQVPRTWSSLLLLLRLCRRCQDKGRSSSTVPSTADRNGNETRSKNLDLFSLSLSFMSHEPWARVLEFSVYCMLCMLCTGRGCCNSHRYCEVDKSAENETVYRLWFRSSD